MPVELPAVRRVDPLRAEICTARIGRAQEFLWILTAYVEGASIRQIADHHGLSRKVVHCRLVALGLSTTDSA